MRCGPVHLMRRGQPSEPAPPRVLSRRFLDRINASGMVFLSSTRIHDRVTLRMCILSHRTHREHVDQALDIIHRAAREP